MKNINITLKKDPYEEWDEDDDWDYDPNED